MTSRLAAAPSGTQRTPWFASWFDSAHYHRLYNYRNDGEASRFIDALIARLRPAEGADILDLGCGSGRHSKYLASKGFRVTGLDLSPGSITAAKRFETAGLRFRRHDMRVPFGHQEYDGVFSFFTSFGYFDDLAEHLAVVRNMADALRPGGVIVVDYLNVRYAEARVSPEETRTIDGTTYTVTRWSDARHFFKRIVVDDRRQDEPIEYRERVAKFGLDEFRRMFRCCGLRMEQVFGDYTLGAYDTQSSPRTIMVARKAPGAGLSPREVLSNAAEGFWREPEVRREHPLWHA